MPRLAPPNAEPIILSPEDEDLLHQLVFRRSFHKDGSIRYVQVVGTEQQIEAAAEQRLIESDQSADKPLKSASLPRLIARRTLQRNLTSNELVQPQNGLNGDCRRSNLRIVTRSQVYSGDRARTSASGAKYVYPKNGRFYVRYRDRHLGSYDTVELAQQAIKSYLELIGSGVSDTEAARRVKTRFRNSSRVVIKP